MKKKIILVLFIFVVINGIYGIKISFAAWPCPDCGEIAVDRMITDISNTKHKYSFSCDACSHSGWFWDDHIWNRESATCTEDKKCTVCDYVGVAALGHNYTSQTTTSTYLKSTATCTSVAVYYYKCIRCTAKGTNTYTYGSSLGHSWTKTCSSCGQANIICSRNNSHIQSHDCAISISANPSATSVKEGESATFSVTASGNNIDYQWYYNNSGQSTGGILVNGATSASYTISSVTSDMNNRYYYCVLTNGSMSTSTPAAKLTVWYSHGISAHPSDVKVKKDETATFNVGATGGNPGNYTYQWYSATTSTSSGTAISGATNSKYTYTPTENIHERYYYCVVSNGYYEVTSNRAKLVADVTRPTINIGTPSNTSININTIFTVPIIVTDTGEGLDISSFSSSDVIIKVNGTQVTPTIKDLVYSSTSGNNYTYTLTLQGIISDGTLTIEISSESISDNFENKNLSTSMLITGLMIDNELPVISKNGSVEGTNDGYINKEDTIKIPIKITDVGGIDPSQFTKEDVIVKAGGTEVKDAVVSVTYVENKGDDYEYIIAISNITEEGELSLEIPENKVIDKASNGNDKTVIFGLDVIVDNTAPKITKVVLSLGGYNSSTLYPSSLPSTNESWINENVYVVVNAIDEGTLPSAVESYWHSEGNTTNFVQLTADREIWQKEMNNTVYYRVVDKAGNISEIANVVIKIDKTSPIPAGLTMKHNRENGLTYIYDVTNPATNYIYIKPEVTTDTGMYQSGILKTEYIITFNNGAITEVFEPINGNISTLIRDTGTYTIEVLTTDKAGNVASRTYNAIIEKKVENTVRINNLHDEGSGIAKVTITARKQGATVDAIEPVVIVKPGASITERIKLADGTYIIKVEIEDGVGLVTTLQKTIVNIIN